MEEKQEIETKEKVDSAPEKVPESGKDWKQIAKTVFFSFMWLGILLVIVDQITKWSIYHLLGGKEGNSLEIIPNFLYFRLYFNKGMSYGMFSDSTVWRIILCIISWIASGVIIYFWVKNLKNKDSLMNVVAALVFAGAVGNGIDRAFYWQSIAGFDGVIDFIVIYFFGPNVNPPFGVFNVADACLSIGVVMFVIIYIVRAVKAAIKEKKR